MNDSPKLEGLKIQLTMLRMTARTVKLLNKENTIKWHKENLTFFMLDVERLTATLLSHNAPGLSEPNYEHKMSEFLSAVIANISSIFKTLKYLEPNP
jgi:hypothetical protein